MECCRWLWFNLAHLKVDSLRMQSSLPLECNQKILPYSIHHIDDLGRPLSKTKAHFRPQMSSLPSRRRTRHSMPSATGLTMQKTTDSKHTFPNSPTPSKTPLRCTSTLACSQTASLLRIRSLGTLIKTTSSSPISPQLWSAPSSACCKSSVTSVEVEAEVSAEVATTP